MASTKYEYIDSLRGIAMLLAIMVHVQFIDGMGAAMSYFSPIAKSIILTGSMGINLFFIASAFTLMLSHQKRQHEEHANRNFFIRRFFRIAPLYYLAIFYFTFAYFVGFDLSNIDWGNVPKKDLILNVLFVNGLFPKYIHHYVPGGWSITIEFMFYALFPFLFSKLKTVNQAFVFTLAILLFSTVFSLLLKDTGADINNYLRYNLVAKLPIFSLGMLAYHFFADKEAITKLKLSSLVFFTITLFVFCYTSVSRDFLFSVVFFFLLVILTRKAYVLFSNKIFAKIGTISFSLYLTHFAIMSLFNRFECFRWMESKITDSTSAYLCYILGYLCLFSVSFIVSSITYRLIEVPGQNLGRKLIKRLDQQK